MNKLWVLAACLACVYPVGALADNPRPLTVTETVEINAPPAKVWEAIRDFDGLPNWHPGFAKDEIVKGTNNKVGAVRSLTLKDGPTFTEELLAYSNKERMFKYKIVESPLPITNYVSTMRVKPTKGHTSKVVWTGTFKRKNTDPNPPEDQTDAGVTKLITGAYRGGLDNLKKKLEGS